MLREGHCEGLEEYSSLACCISSFLDQFSLHMYPAMKSSKTPAAKHQLSESILMDGEGDPDIPSPPSVREARHMMRNLTRRLELPDGRIHVASLKSHAIIMFCLAES